MSDTASTSRTFGPVQLARHCGLSSWHVDYARADGLLPDPDRAGDRWSAAAAERARERAAEVLARYGPEHPIGAARAATRLTTRTGFEITGDDITRLADSGHLTAVDEYKGHPLYAIPALDNLTSDTLRQIIDERHHDGDQTLGPEQAAARLRIRRIDFDYCRAAGWITPIQHVSATAGWSTPIDVPLYRTSEVDALLERPEVDWDTVRASVKGSPSPLRRYASPTPARGTVIRTWVHETSAAEGIDMWAWWSRSRNRWEIDWHPRADGTPSSADITAAIAAEPAVAAHSSHIELGCETGAAIRFARAMLEPGAAVIVDTETTDLFGAVCEIAAIDANTGRVLLDTLVNPETPIQSGAEDIHGISDDEVAQAPRWPAVYRQLLQITHGRTILAYNADYDYDVILADCRRHDITPRQLADRAHWADVMLPRSAHARTQRWLPNGGGHRALDDVYQTRQHLLRMTEP